MLTPPAFFGFDAAYRVVVDHVCSVFQYRNAPRGNASRECLGMSFTLTQPWQRLAFVAARKVNPIFHFAEALWHVAGRSDLEMIAYYAPRLRQDSPDGLRLWGSAHGSRVFTRGDSDISPFERVLELLRAEKDTKRAVLPIFQGSELAIPGNPDVSCTVALHLLAREGALHLVCYQRASDADRGLLADVFSFTTIQEYAAIQLGLEVGYYTHHVGSLHLAESDLPRIDRVLSETAQRVPDRPRFLLSRMPATTTATTVTAVLQHEEALRTNRHCYSPQDVADLPLEPYWQQVVALFEIQRQLSHTDLPVDPAMMAMLEPGLAWLTAHRWPARMPPAAAEVIGS